MYLKIIFGGSFLRINGVLIISSYLIKKKELGWIFFIMFKIFMYYFRELLGSNRYNLSIMFIFVLILEMGVKVIFIGIFEFLL